MRLKFFNLSREKAQRIQVDPVGDFIPYGEQNAFPLKISKLVDESTVGSACRGTVSDFIEGEGFSTEATGEQVINSQGETFGEFHRKNAESLSPFWGYAWLITYNAAGERTQVFSLPFENCRLGRPDGNGVISKIHYNSYFGTALYRIKDNICYDVWNPDPAIVKAQMDRDLKAGKKYMGQVFYYGTTSAMNRFYPMPEYWSARYWMEVDKRIGEYHQKNLQNGFLQPVMMRVIGDPNAPSTDPRHANTEPQITVGEAFDEDMAEEFAGSERVGHVMVAWANTKEEFPDLIPFPGNNQEGYMTALVTQFKDLIATSWKVPPILANILSGAQLGGDGNVIRASVKLMQQRVVRWHHNLEMNYKKVLGIDTKIVHYNPFPEMASIDPQVWAALTIDEQRQWIKDNTEVNLLQVSPMQATNQFSNIVRLKIGDTVKVKNGAEHEKEHKGMVMTVAQISTPAIAVKMEDGTIHKWYVESELEKIKDNPTNKFSNVYYDTYPDKARKNAAKAQKYQVDKGTICQAKFSRELTQSIIDGKPISMKDISRIKNFLEKNAEYKGDGLGKCEAVNYLAWGGDEMLKWATEKVNEVR